MFFHVTFLSTECDALTGCKISSIDIGARVVRMSYSPKSGHAVIAMLQVIHCIWDFSTFLSIFNIFFSLLLFFFFYKESNFIKQNERIKAAGFL